MPRFLSRLIGWVTFVALSVLPGNVSGAAPQVGVITRVVGGFGANAGPEVNLIAPTAIVRDAAGDFYIATADNSSQPDHRIRKYTVSSGVLSIIAGLGPAGFSGDGGPATAARLSSPLGLAIDAAGDLYVSDRSNNRIRKITLSTGIITTVAGGGGCTSSCGIAFSGDGGLATAARLADPAGLAFDAAGNLYIADETNVRVRKVNAGSGAAISTVAGGGNPPFPSIGDSGPATSAVLRPHSVAFDAAGNLFIADRLNQRIRRVAAGTGTITTYAGTFGGGGGFTGDGGAATAAELNSLTSVVVDSGGNVFLTANNRIRMVAASTGIITTVAGGGSPGVIGGINGDGGPATAAQITPENALVDAAGNIYVLDTSSRSIRMLTPASVPGMLMSTHAGAGSGADGSPAASAQVSPLDLALDSAGNLYIAEGARIRKITAATGIISTVAGTGTPGYGGDGGSATFARLSGAGGIAVDTAGNLYVADQANNRIRKVAAATGVITTVAGDGQAGFSGDNGPATAARLNSPADVAVDSAGNLYIADQSNSRIRKVTAATGVMTTVAGNGAFGFSNTTSPATSVPLSNPSSVAVDDRGNLFIVDKQNLSIRIVTASTGLISTILGGVSTAGFDNEGANYARMNAPTQIAVDARGDFYFADTQNNRIRKYSFLLQRVTTIAGVAELGLSGDGRAPTTAQLNQPQSMAVDTGGNVYIADTGNARVRKVASTPLFTLHPSDTGANLGSSATFTCAAGGAATNQWQVSTDGGATWSDATDASAYSGTTTGSLTVRTVTSTSGGTRFRCAATNDIGTALSEAATLTINAAPIITSPPSSVTVVAGATAQFSASVTGSPAPAAQWQVSADAGATWSVIAGATSATYTFSTTALDNGRQYRVVFSNSSGTATSQAATLTVRRPPMSLDRTSLTFAATNNGSGFTSQTVDQTVRLIQTAGPAVPWTATVDRPWLTVAPASGAGTSTVRVGVKSDSTLPAGGTVTGTITFSMPGVGDALGPVTVTLVLTSPAVPFGSLDTPAGDGTTLAGSVAVTGWALDNIGVKRVELWRDLIAGESAPPFVSTPTDPRNGKIFISNATFVDGARPDVEALYPTTPLNYRAGWGYLLLTWGLPNQGNGTYQLYAFAFDEENTVSTIGTKTMLVANNTATKPFGSIDTPAIGGEASGPNYGWALTPKVNGAATCRIPASGVQVSIDSGPLQPVVYGDARSDIAAAFAGFSNSAAAGGHYIIDWTTLTNGVHTIAWLVTDNCNRADGIGSRFFNVFNGTNLTATEPLAGTSAMRVAETESDAPIAVARGFGELPVVVAPGEAGSRTVEIKQGERIEIRLPHGFASAYELAKDGERRVLPAGSTWDSASGIFYWQPAPGFLGRYRLVFSNGAERINVRLVVTP